MPPSAPANAPAPLPVAAERAVLSNRIALLFAKQSSLRANLNRASSDRPPAAGQRSRAVPDDEDDAVTAGGANPNAGPGYVPSRKETAEAATDRMLRGRLLGKRRAEGAAKAKAAESESDEDEGRSGLGKRKRPRRERRVDVDAEAQEEATPSEGHVGSGGREADAGDGGDVEDDNGTDAEAARVTTEYQTQADEPQESATKKRKNKKKKKKNKGGDATGQQG